MSVGSPTAGTWSSSQWRPDNEFETDSLKARRVIGEWIGFYTTERPHSALGGRTPAEAYRGARPVDMMDTSLRAVPTSPQAAEHRHGNQGPRNQAA